MKQYKYKSVFTANSWGGGSIETVEKKYGLIMNSFGSKGWEIFQVETGIEHYGEYFMLLHMRKEIL